MTAAFLAALTSVAAGRDDQDSAAPDAIRATSIATAEQRDDTTATLRRFNHQALLVLFHARREFSLRPRAALAQEHVLLGILRADMTLISAHLPTDPNAVQLESVLLRHLASDLPTLPEQVEVPLGPTVRTLIERAAGVADELGGGSVEPGHLLVALLRDATSPATRLLGDNGVTAEAVLERLRQPW